MSRLSDYQDRMTLKQFADEDIDQLVSSQIANDPELADLAAFLTEFRIEHIVEPPPAEVQQLARSAAAVVRSRPAPVRTSPRSQRRRNLLTALRTSSAMAMSILALVVFSGLGLAANAAVPGDFLYGLDLAMEKVGIGAGGIEERISEAKGLADRGQHTEAADHLKASIAKYGDEASAEEVSKALHALDVYGDFVDDNGTPDMAPPPANENAGPGNNNAGGNSDNTPGNTAPGNSDNTPGNTAPGNSDNTPGNTAPGNSDNTPGNNAGGNSDNTPGNNAGGNSDNTPGNTAPGNSDNVGGGNNNGGGGKGGN